MLAGHAALWMTTRTSRYAETGRGKSSGLGQWMQTAGNFQKVRALCVTRDFSIFSMLSGVAFHTVDHHLYSAKTIAAIFKEKRFILNNGL